MTFKSSVVFVVIVVVFVVVVVVVNLERVNVVVVVGCFRRLGGVVFGGATTEFDTEEADAFLFVGGRRTDEGKLRE